MLKNLLLGGALAGVIASVSVAQVPQTPPAGSSAPPAATAPSSNRPVTQQAPNTVRARTLIGLDIKNNQDETIGEIDDVVVDAEGRIQQVVVSVGGFLGVGARSVAISWADLRFDAQREVAVVNMTKDQLSQQPEFQRRRAEPAPSAPALPSAPAPRTNN